MDLRHVGLGLVVITVVGLTGDRVRLGITADESITVDRGEVHEARERDRREGAR